MRSASNCENEATAEREVRDIRTDISYELYTKQRMATKTSIPPLLALASGVTGDVDADDAVTFL